MCHDCGVNQGSKVRVWTKRKFWQTQVLCGECCGAREADGERVISYYDWEAQREDARADRELSER